MRFLLASIGSNGDIHPFAGVGMALRARGHEVALMSQPYFERLIREAGLEFIPVGERFDMAELARHPEMMNPRTGSLRIIRDHIIPRAPLMFAAATDAIARARPDAILCHHLAFGISWAAERAGVPCATACLSPMLLMSAHDRSVFFASGREGVPGLRHRIFKWVALAASSFLYDRPLNRIRRSLDFPPLKDQLVHDALRGPLTLGLWSEHFRAPMPDDPPNARICGFPWFDRHREQEHAPADIERFLDAGEPPVVFTLGSTAVHVAGTFYEAAADACRRLGLRGLLLTGRPEYAPRSLPPGVAAFTYAPYSSVLPRARAIVHHGGIGTTAQSMRAGKPTVIVPFAHDQFDNAARARRLGVSVTVARPKVSGATLAAAVNTACSESARQERAQALGTRLSAEDGAAKAAGLLEQVTIGPIV